MSIRATNYKSIEVDGLSIFYREAGSPGAPNLLLLHGFPSSSRMYEPLFTRLADAFHLIAPDNPEFGHREAPDPREFDYTFDNIARIIERFTELLRIDRYNLFVQDYGGPVGFRHRQPPVLVLWGRFDPSFQVEEAEAYHRDVPNAEVRVLDAGHFALDEKPATVARLTRKFLLSAGGSSDRRPGGPLQTPD